MRARVGGGVGRRREGGGVGGGGGGGGGGVANSHYCLGLFIYRLVVA